jgi:hypothetical protein
MGFKHFEETILLVSLQERNYKKNGVEYTQYRITISQKIVESLNWNGNDSLELITKDGTIIVKNQMKKNS